MYGAARARARGVSGAAVQVGATSATSNGRLGLITDPMRLSLVILTIVTISRVHQHYPILEKFRVALLLVVASVGYAYLNPKFLTKANIFRFWPMKFVVLLAAWSCGSAVFGISLGATALFILSTYIKVIAYAILIAVAVRHVRDLYTFVWAYVISCGILAFFSIFVFGISKSANSYVTRLSNLYMYDSNDVCVVLMVGLPLTLLLISVERGAKRWLLATTLIGIAATVARSGSRGGFLGFIAVGVAALFLLNEVSAPKRVIVTVVALISLAMAAPPGYWQQMGTIMTPKQDYNYYDRDGRKAVMQRGIGYMDAYPVFGLGIGNFSRAECTISPKIEANHLYGPLRCTAPHNSYVQAGAEMGFPGLLMWVGLVAGLIIAPLRLRRRLPRSLLRGNPTQRFLYSATTYFSIAGIGFAVTSFFVSFAWMDPVYFMAAMLTGLYISVRSDLSVAKPGLHSAPESTTGLTFSGAGWRARRSAWRAALKDAYPA